MAARDRRRAPRLLAGAVGLAVALVGCGPAPPAEVAAGAGLVTDGVLTACVAPTPRLVVPTTDGEQPFEGYDVEALSAVADQLDVELRLVESSYDDIVSGVAVNDGRCGIGAGGIVPGPELDDLVQVTTSYRQVDRLLVAPPPTSGPVDALTVGIEDGGPAADALPALEAAEVVEAPSLPDLARLLAIGDVDAVLVPAQDVPVVAEGVGGVDLLAAVSTGDRTVMVLPRGVDEQARTLVDEALRSFEEGPAQDAARRWLQG